MNELGWLDNFLPAPMAEEDDSKRRSEFPEQYPATYELLHEHEVTDELSKFDTMEESKIARFLLKNTMLEQRRLQTVYDAEIHGWNAASFHEQVDGKGAAVIIATLLGADGEGTKMVGGYNPKGWSSTGGARPSIAAFVFYELKLSSSSSGNRNSNSNSNDRPSRFQKLKKVGGGGLACARDDPDYGISLGPDALVIPLQEGRERMASSKLGPYYERGPEDRSSLFEKAGVQINLTSLKILTGVYNVDEEIPYNGAVLDMTSG